jgi:hypothetical protein
MFVPSLVPVASPSVSVCHLHPFPDAVFCPVVTLIIGGRFSAPKKSLSSPPGLTEMHTEKKQTDYGEAA